jgi:hypothetical protein
MSEAIPVKVTIEPSDNNGFATWVRSDELPSRVWSKWYSTEHAAYVEAESLGFAVSQVFMDAHPHLPFNERRTLKGEALADPEQLSSLFSAKLVHPHPHSKNYCQQTSAKSHVKPPATSKTSQPQYPRAFSHFK